MEHHQWLVFLVPSTEVSCLACMYPFSGSLLFRNICKEKTKTYPAGFASSCWVFFNLVLNFFFNENGENILKITRQDG